jgi:hypothetical protein
LAGFNRGFRFIGQKHICAAAKKETPHRSRNQKPKIQGKSYETQPQQIRGHFALRMCGHYLLAHGVGESSRAWEGAGYEQNANNRRDT